jgi:hypothetical protein
MKSILLILAFTQAPVSAIELTPGLYNSYAYLGAATMTRIYVQRGDWRNGCTAATHAVLILRAQPSSSSEALPVSMETRRAVCANAQ